MVEYDWEYQALKDVESLKLAEAVIKPLEFVFLNESTQRYFTITEPYKWMMN